MKFGLYLSDNINSNSKAVVDFVKAAQIFNFECFFMKVNQNIDAFDYLVVFGGDGTVIQCIADYRPSVPVITINLGRVGFLCQINPMYSEYVLALAKILEKDVAINELTTLSIVNNQKEFLVLNDFVIAAENRSHTCDLALSLNGKSVGQYFGDGVVISTPTGSTAYNLTINGPALNNNVNAFIINSFTKNVSPIVYGDDAVLHIKIVKGKCNVYLDGSMDTSVYTENDFFEIKKSSYSAKILMFSDNFFDKLRKKQALDFSPIG